MKTTDFDGGIENCTVSNVLNVIHGKWGMVIIYFLNKEGVLRFSELKRKIPKVTEANLTKELRKLEEYGLIHREVYPVVPPKVEYSLTNIGKEFIPVLDALEVWAEKYTATLQ